MAKKKLNKTQRKDQEKMALMYEDCDDTFAFIAAYTKKMMLVRFIWRKGNVRISI